MERRRHRIRLPESEERIPLEDLLFDPDEIEELVVVARLPGTALFATGSARRPPARCCSRAGRRGDARPLWQQRQRGADLLEVASRYPTFPILLETTRECLRDVFDVPALKEVLGDIRARRIRVVPVDTPRSSPFAQSLLFRWIAVYMYEATRRWPSAGPRRSRSIATCSASCSAPRSCAS